MREENDSAIVSADEWNHPQLRLQRSRCTRRLEPPDVSQFEAEAMKLSELQDKAIESAMRSAHAMYKDEPDKFAGCVAGLTECRGKSPEQLGVVLVGANTALSLAYAKQDRRYWEVAMFHAEVEGICDVMSAALKGMGKDPIIEPSKAGYDKAVALLGGSAVIVLEKTELRH